MTATTARPTVARIDDHEGQGECGNCRRTGLRWIATLTDGSEVGLECAKQILGWKPRPVNYDWIKDFRPVAEAKDCDVTYVLWQHKAGNATRTTRNGSLWGVGAQRAEWVRNAWLAAEAVA